MAENEKQRQARLRRWQNVSVPTPADIDAKNNIIDAAKVFEKALNDNAPEGSDLANAQLAVESAVRNAHRAIDQAAEGEQ